MLLSTSAGAVFVENRLSDPKLEARAQVIAEGIRCLVCQNQSIMDSNADLAKDLRALVRERIQAGDSDDDVRQYLVDRYGDWVLLNPPFKLRTALLWIGPLLVFIGGGFAMFLFLRRRNDTAGITVAPKPLSEKEQAELDRLLTASDEESRS
ncbi:MAG: cytochrome c-type biogenesis protein CcmH [Sneathiella sp.]|nr:cytochrome c-type biogenesis protein CcmH [Sneathiella sp.]